MIKCSFLSAFFCFSFSAVLFIQLSSLSIIPPVIKQVGTRRSDLVITIESIQSKLPVLFKLPSCCFLLGSILNYINKNENKNPAITVQNLSVDFKQRIFGL